MNNIPDLTWADGEAKAAADMIASRAVAARMAGTLTDNEHANALTEYGISVLNKSAERDWSNLGKADFWKGLASADTLQNQHGLSPAQLTALKGSLIGAGAGGLVGLGASLYRGGRRPLLDTLLGAGLGAGLGGTGGYLYHERDRQNVSPAVQKEEELKTIRENYQEELKKAPTAETSTLGQRTFPGDLSGITTPDKPSLVGSGLRGAATGLAIGSAPGLMRGLVNGVGRLRGPVMTPHGPVPRAPVFGGDPSFLRRIVERGGALTAGLGAVGNIGDDIYNNRMTPNQPTIPLTADVEAVGKNPELLKDDAMRKRLAPLMKKQQSFNKSSALFTVDDIRNHWNSLPEEQRAAIIGGGAGSLGLGALGYALGGEKRVRNALLGALLGGGLGAGTGYAAYSPSQQTSDAATGGVSVSGTPAGAAPTASWVPPTTEEIEHQEQVQMAEGLPRTGRYLGTGLGGLAGGLAATKAAPALLSATSPRLSSQLAAWDLHRAGPLADAKKDLAMAKDFYTKIAPRYTHTTNPVDKQVWMAPWQANYDKARMAGDAIRGNSRLALRAGMVGLPLAGAAFGNALGHQAARLFAPPMPAPLPPK